MKPTKSNPTLLDPLRIPGINHKHNPVRFLVVLFPERSQVPLSSEIPEVEAGSAVCQGDFADW